MKEVPYDTRDLAITCYTSAYKASLELLKNKHIKKFEHKFLTKKDNNDVFYATKIALDKEFKIFKRRLKKSSQLKMRNKIRKSLNRSSDGSFPIIRNKAGHYYLCIVQKYINKPKLDISKDSIVALDPGVRTFMTYYSQMECGTLGDKFNLKIRKVNKRIDKLEGLNKENNAKKRYNLKRRCLILRSKITNMVNDLHWQSASFLTRKYNVVILPIFKSKQMAMQNLNKKVNREMFNLSHFKFKERIKYKAKLNNCQVLDCCESYTSKTCTQCGELNNVGSKKIYNCSKCKVEIDRDINGARNIFIRSLTKYYTG